MLLYQKSLQITTSVDTHKVANPPISRKPEAIKEKPTHFFLEEENLVKNLLFTRKGVGHAFCALILNSLPLSLSQTLKDKNYGVIKTIEQIMLSRLTLK